MALTFVTVHLLCGGTKRNSKLLKRIFRKVEHYFFLIYLRINLFSGFIETILEKGEVPTTPAIVTKYPDTPLDILNGEQRAHMFRVMSSLVHEMLKHSS